MKAAAHLRPPQPHVPFSSPTPPHPHRHSTFHLFFSSSPPPPPPQQVRHESSVPKLEYKPGVFDDLFLNLFRSKMVQEVGFDSNKPGYDGLIEVANHMVMKNKSNSDTKEAAVRILRSLFPPWLLELYKMLVAPIAGGKVAAVMVARVTAITCQWLMGRCSVNSVDLPDGTSCASGFKFGVHPSLPEDDAILKEPCLEICPNATRRRELAGNRNAGPQCPKA
ncbi:hypothetical protein TIFTF001_021433 [Ficus carica]|uniref:Beta-carotene isomerase D27-like C-terminal domain-containing protein n=1 Tax=Ficus carica TaxID=3494 RepID=A0AA88AAF1_FICCA|nr:hypothetical protein TIFTF001_021433 [Ficus carica]